MIINNIINSFGRNFFSKKSNLNKGIFFAVILVFAFSNLTFAADVPQDTYGDVLFDIGIITGYDGDLMSDKAINRAEMIAIISKFYPNAFEAYTPPKTATFKDVPTTHWAYKYVEFAYENGITAGKGNGMFGVTDPINYNQASIFIIKALGFVPEGLVYDSAALQIEAEYGLKLTIPTLGSSSLIRSDVFELLGKSLVMKDSSEYMPISRFVASGAEVDAYSSRITQIINTPVAVYLTGSFFNIYYANGDVYTGEFDGSHLTGSGMTQFANGDLYIGQYANDFFNGYGLYIWSDNENYEGYWLDGRFHGLGTYTYVDGAYQYGEWENDALVTPIEEVSDVDVANGVVQPSEFLTVILTDANGKPMKGIAISVEDQFSEIAYNLVSNTDGEVVVPLTGQFSVLSLVLPDNSAYKFEVTGHPFAATTAGIYKTNVTFVLLRD
ncbi:MAG: hypothetical protein BGO41_13415 [Clostridiales bacterium 38-18]|nr:MAG: hypothetical protein BGO41_13415 [Clostridiales bacterium 38-18]